MSDFTKTVLGRIKIGGRVALLVCLPFIGFLAMGGLVLQDRHHVMRDLEHAGEITLLSKDIGALVHELQKERGASGVVINSKGAQFRSELEGYRSAADEHLAAYQRRAARVEPSASDAVRRRLATAGAGLERLAAVRENVDKLRVSGPLAAESYT